METAAKHDPEFQDPFLRRLGRELLPTEPYALMFLMLSGLLIAAVSFVMLLLGAPWRAVLLFAALLIPIASMLCLVFVHVSDLPAKALFGLGRKVDGRQMELEDLRDQAASAERNHLFGQAVKLYREILARQLSEKPERVWFRIALIHNEHLRDYRSASAAYRRALGLLGQEADGEDEPEEDAVLRRECKERLESLIQRIKEADRGVTARRQEITALVEDELFSEARARIDQLNEDDPGDAENDYLKGFILARSGSYELGIEHYRKALERDPDHLRARYNLAAALDIVQRNPEAIEVYEEYLQRAAGVGDEEEWIARARMQLSRLRQEEEFNTVAPPE